MSQIPLTVLMTVRNGEPYLREAIQSILAQTYRDFRFLILDNASTDNSREVVRSFNDPRIDLVELPADIGQTAALNQGLAMIESPYVARIDADDIAYPKRLARQVAYLNAHPEVALVAGNVDWFDTYGRIVQNETIPTSDTEIVWKLIFTNPLAHSSIAIRHDAIIAVGGYDETFQHAMDYELYCALMRRSFRLACLRVKVGAIRLYPSSFSSTFRELRKLEPAKTCQRNLLHFLSDLPCDQLDKVGTVLWDGGHTRSEETVSSAIEALVRICSAATARQPTDSAAMERVQADLARRIAFLGWSNRETMPEAARLADWHIQRLVSGPGRRKIYSGLSEACLSLAFHAGSQGNRRQFKAQLRRALSFASYGAAAFMPGQTRLAELLFTNTKMSFHRRWWIGMLVCGALACTIAPFFAGRKGLSFLAREIRRAVGSLRSLLST